MRLANQLTALSDESSSDSNDEGRNACQVKKRRIELQKQHESNSEKLKSDANKLLKAETDLLKINKRITY